eukprot:179217_1
MKRIFSDSKDHQQCVNIFSTIETSKSRETLDIPSCISQEIAELSVGTVRICRNQNCQNDIVILQCDEGKKSKHYIRDDILKNYYCSNCMIHTERCRSGSLIFFPNVVECDWCCHRIKQCDIAKDYDCNFCSQTYLHYKDVLCWRCDAFKYV